MGRYEGEQRDNAELARQNAALAAEGEDRARAVAGALRGKAVAEAALASQRAATAACWAAVSSRPSCNSRRRNFSRVTSDGVDCTCCPGHASRGADIGDLHPDAGRHAGIASGWSKDGGRGWPAPLYAAARRCTSNSKIGGAV